MAGSSALAVRARPPGEKRWLAAIFLGPAVILLAAILVYPLVYSVVRSLFGDKPSGAAAGFVWLRNYSSIFTDDDTLRAVGNNIVWVIVVPAVVTILGLIFAVLTEHVRWATAFKTVLFVPMAISGLAVGVTFALIYTDQPSRGLANTVTVGIHDLFHSSTGYPGEHPLDAGTLKGSASAGYTTVTPYAAGSVARLPLVGLDLHAPPSGLQPARSPVAGPGITGVVWNDFKLGGGGAPKQVDPGELGLSGVTVQALQGGSVVASTTTGADGTFTLPSLTSGSYQLRLAPASFSTSYGGVTWLGSTKITPAGPSVITLAIILAYLWVYAGFAMVLLAAGMSAIPRDALEAARMDGATEWQVFRKVTAPLLAPVLMVVFVTMVINVLKVFDLVFIISQSAGANGKYADVLATRLFEAYGTQRYGIASAIGVILVILVLPAMAFNIRRFRQESR
jgi:alpha-glucoside transport system permease protein